VPEKSHAAEELNVYIKKSRLCCGAGQKKKYCFDHHDGKPEESLYIGLRKEDLNTKTSNHQ
jgi:hypothetical protein